jgi:hypothetical protein
MNYFAHGLHYLELPYVLVGTAVPDLLSITDRRVRVAPRLARQCLHDADAALASVARGIVRHYHDDAWFHQTPAFAALNLDFTVRIRDALAGDDGFRPSFLGHVLVEILADATLMEQYPEKLEAYYRALDAVDASAVAAAVGRMATGPVTQLARTIELFRWDRFLYDYADDAKLLQRLNRIMRRVNLAELPPGLVDVLPAARHAVRARLPELLSGLAPAPEP